MGKNNIIVKVLDKYNALGRPVKAAFWYTVMSVVQNGLTFLVTPIYTRILTTDEYGFYSLYSTWYSILMIFATLNLAGGGFNNAMLKFDKDKNRYMSSMLGLSNTITIIVFGIVFAFISPLSKWSGLDVFSFVCIFVVLLFNPALGLWTSAQRFDYNYRLMSIITILQAVLVPVVSIFLIAFMPNKKYALALGNASVQVVFGICFYLYLVSKGRRLYVRKYWKFALTFNTPLVPHYLSAIILGQADRIMINMYCGQDQVGIYSLGYSISQLVSIFVTAISTAYAPWSYKQIKNGNEKEIGKYTNYIMVLVGAIVVLSVLVGPELICFLGTEAYYEAKWMMPPVMLSCFFTMIYGFFANIEFYYEKSIYVMIASIIAAISNVVLNAVFIPRFGYLAAGYTTLLSYIMLAFMHYFFMKIVCKKSAMGRIYNEKFILVFSLFVIAIVFLLMLMYPFTVIRYVIVAVILSVLFFKRNIIIGLVVKKADLEK
jgi:O-antigen/teichoic acid export membrane protein